MAERKLTGFVTVHDEQGQSHTFGPDDELPDWAAKAITNPDAWEGGEAAEAAGDEAKSGGGKGKAKSGGG